MTEIISIQGLPFLACIVMLAILCYIGIHVLKREIIFIDIALAQIAAVGAIAADVIFHIHDHSIYAHILAVGTTIAAAAFFAIVRRRIRQVPLEAVIGVSYAVSAAAALFLVGVAPGGHVHIEEMLSGSILWATWNDVVWSAGIFAAVGLCFYAFRRPFRMISEDYEGAVAGGYNTVGWDFLFYVLVGIVITTAVRVAGVVVVFTFLIIPATLSAAIASGWMGRLLVAWVFAAVSAAVGLLFAERFDFSVGPAIALFLGEALVVVGVLRLARVARGATAVVCLLISVTLGVWFVGGSTARDARPKGGFGAAPEAASITHAHSHGVDPPPRVADDTDPETDEIDRSRLASLTDVAQLEALYNDDIGVEERSEVVCRTLEVDARSGARMAIEFLRNDPPLLFRLTVVDKIEEVTSLDISYDIDQAFTTPPNQEAVARLTSELGMQ